MKKTKRLFMFFSLCFLSLLCFTICTYEKIFGRRFDEYRPFRLTLHDFPSLIATPVSFYSGKDLLRGNFYTSTQATCQKHALIVFCHGFSNGSHDYLSQINYFANHGFSVLAYDNTGCYTSTGKSVKGLPQAIINLHDVLNTLTTYNQTPLILMGHSWGGYAVNSVLQSGDFSTVCGIVSFSAPNSSQDMLLNQGRLLFGPFVYLLLPFTLLIQRLKFGKYATYDAASGVNHHCLPVLAFHSLDDPIVRYKYSLAAQGLCITNPHTFLRSMNCGKHNLLLSTQAKSYAQKTKRYLEEKGWNQGTIPIESLLQDVDKMQLYELNETLLAEILEFIQTCFLPSQE